MSAVQLRELPLETKRLLWTGGIVVGTSLPHWATLPIWIPLLLASALAWRFGSSLYRWPAARRPVCVLLAVGYTIVVVVCGMVAGLILGAAGGLFIGTRGMYGV